MRIKKRIAVTAAALTIAALAGPTAVADPASDGVPAVAAPGGGDLVDTPPDTVEESPEAAPGQMTDPEPGAGPLNGTPATATLGAGDLVDTPPDTVEESPEAAPGQMTDPEPSGPMILQGNYQTMWTDDPSPAGGYVLFEPGDRGGDYVQLKDVDGDGLGVRITVWDETKDPDLHKFTYYNRLGKDNFVYSHAGMGGPYDLAEGNCFKFRIQLVTANSVVENSTDYAQWTNSNFESQNCDHVE
ncbi:hypothetical protein AB0O39_35715 [Streptomyces anulatus]|uniref:hypothetical protein n=1 Tax=Streptomyces anulatus TaxID=1892 RepID=UPI003442E3DB